MMFWFPTSPNVCFYTTVWNRSVKLIFTRFIRPGQWLLLNTFLRLVQHWAVVTLPTVPTHPASTRQLVHDEICHNDSSDHEHWVCVCVCVCGKCAAVVSNSVGGRWCCVRRMSLSPTRSARLFTTQSPRRLPTSTTAASTAGTSTSTVSRQQQQCTGTSNEFAVRLQRETEALLQRAQTTHTSISTTAPAPAAATKLRTFTACGSVTVSPHCHTSLSSSSSSSSSSHPPGHLWAEPSTCSADLRSARSCKVYCLPMAF